MRLFNEKTDRLASNGFMKFVRKDGLLLDMTGTGWYIWHTIEV